MQATKVTMDTLMTQVVTFLDDSYHTGVEGDTSLSDFPSDEAQAVLDAAENLRIAIIQLRRNGA